MQQSIIVLYVYENIMAFYYERNNLTEVYFVKVSYNS